MLSNKRIRLSPVSGTLCSSHACLGASFKESEWSSKMESAIRICSIENTCLVNDVHWQQCSSEHAVVAERFQEAVAES